ncbi:MAG TPA: NAD(P)/FAD-dependent oxidoreductase [Candidatus Limnocylindrales bacterium]|nr:NAD(P)/FAD-dependent oxidoreductase [Candidatus Limnocylindrales bacterium]
MTAPGGPALDAIVVGAGPNGLAAALTLARAGRSVRLYEGAPTIGGGTRTEELTLPGFRHDVCSTIVPLAVASPFFRSVDWAALGVEFVHPDAPLAHALDDGRAVVLERSFTATAAGLDRDRRTDDGSAWRRIFGPLARDAEKLGRELLGPVIHPPRHPLALARFGRLAVRSASGFAQGQFRGEAARALFGGLAAHGMVALDRPLSASFGLVLGTYAHAVGWPMVRGGTGAIGVALASEIRRLGGEIVLGQPISRLGDLPESRVVLLDTTPRAAIDIAGDRLPERTRHRYTRFRYGAGVFKVDWALDGPIPWTADGLRRAATVHLGGALAEVVRSERQVATGRPPDRPFTLLAQYHPWDTTRAPSGQTTAWAYCHLPGGSDIDMTDRIESQVERFAPGFRDRVLARATRSPARLEAYDPNHIGGDINAGISDIRQILFRPTVALDPYHAGPGLYLCSSSTPPGGGVHGMSGHLAARSALRHDLR